MNKKGILIATFGLISFTVAGDEYIDMQTNVVYTYYPNANSAEVKAGRSYWIGGTEDESEYAEIDESGSPDVKGDINILNIFEIDEHKYKVSKIGDRAFFRCEKMTSVVLPESMVTIGELAFYQCTGLTNIEIPITITSMGLGAFGQCTGLVSIISYIENPFDTDAFRYLNTSNITLYVPKGCEAKYRTTKGWDNFEKITEMEETGISAHKEIEQINTKDLFFDLRGQRLSGPSRNAIYIQKGKKKLKK